MATDSGPTTATTLQKSLLDVPEEDALKICETNLRTLLKVDA